MPDIKPHVSAEALRVDAEEKLRHSPKLLVETEQTGSPEFMQILIHELRVHQIELELQNEELRRTQAELDASRSRYFDLYDLAPVGYCTISEQGLIEDANLTACNLLGIARSVMTKSPFSRLIAPEDQDQYYFHRQRLLTASDPQSCEVRLRRHDGSTVCVQLVSSLVPGPDGSIRQRAVITDITAIKAAETALRKSEEFQLSIFNSLSEQVAILDEHGVIIAVNESWRQFSKANCGSTESANTVGLNYLQLCRQAGVEQGCNHSLQLCTAMRAILEGRQSEYVHEYPCHSPQEKRWFQVHVTRMRGSRLGLIVSHLNVTTRKMAELALEESRRELVLVANHVPGPVARIDHNLRYVFANHHYEQFFGKTIDRVLGHHMQDVLGDELFQQVEPYIHRVLAGEHVTFESEFHSPDRGAGHTLVNYVPDCDSERNVIGFYVLAIDITERKQAAVAKQEALNILQKVTSRVPGAVYQFRLHPDGRVSMPYSNEGLYDLFEIAPKDVRDDATLILAKTHPDDLDGMMVSIQLSARDLTPWTHECRFLINGTEKWLAGNSLPELEPDGSVLWHGFITDVTRRRATEAARESLELQLRESQKMEAIGTLAGGIAHDFNNALAAILGNVDLARAGLDGNELLAGHLGEIERSGLRARNLVQQILSFCRQQPTELQRLSLAEVVHDSAALLRATVPARFILAVHCDEEQSLILADKTQIEQVIINLATNAVQAFGGKSGTITIRVDVINSHDQQRPVDRRLPVDRFSNSDRIVRLSVADNGPGIELSIQERIFEPFFTTKPPGEGTGLGLSVVHGIIRAHNGSIRLESTPGAGTIFTIDFPAALGDADAVANAQPVVTGTPADSSTTFAVREDAELTQVQGRRVLLIDDDEAVLRIAKLLLNRDGYAVTAFADPSVALEELRRNPSAFDVVITDYNMPVMSGLAVAAAVRDLGMNLPVAVASGYVDDELRSGAAEAGVSEFISKPFAGNALSEKIARFFK